MGLVQYFHPQTLRSTILLALDTIPPSNELAWVSVRIYHLEPEDASRAPAVPREEAESTASAAQNTALLVNHGLGIKKGPGRLTRPRSSGHEPNNSSCCSIRNADGYAASTRHVRNKTVSEKQPNDTPLSHNQTWDGYMTWLS